MEELFTRRFQDDEILEFKQYSKEKIDPDFQEDVRFFEETELKRKMTIESVPVQSQSIDRLVYDSAMDIQLHEKNQDDIGDFQDISDFGEDSRRESVRLDYFAPENTKRKEEEVDSSEDDMEQEEEEEKLKAKKLKGKFENLIFLEFDEDGVFPDMDEERFIMNGMKSMFKKMRANVGNYKKEKGSYYSKRKLKRHLEMTNVKIA